MRRYLLATFAFFPLATLASAQLSMQVQQTIEGFTPTGGTIPVTAEFENNGPDARGVLRVIGQNFRTDYPVEIPRGGKKRLTVYPQNDWGEMSFVLLTDQGRIIQRMSPEMKWQQGQQVLLVISDTPGELAFIRNKSDSPENQLSIQDAYCKPTKAPDRPVGYAGIGAVLLGGGSERLTDREIEALKLWTLSGGTLVFLGGASAPILNDARWAEVLPATGFKSRNVRSMPTLAGMSGRATPVEFSITNAQALPFATATRDGENLVTAERQFGIGKVIYMSFNLLEEPLDRWEGRKKALIKIVRPPELAGRRTFVSAFSRDQSSNMVPPTPIPGSPSSVMAAQQRDPFSTKLPPASQVFLVLAVYFVVVVPLNFLVLKKLGRAELAWFTAPVISLVFAGILFTRAQDLYSAQMSSASQGILVAQEGLPQGLFIGASQVFIPRGGSYDLKLDEVDSVGIVENQEGYGYGYGRRDRNATVDLDPIDDGSIHVPALRANNLAFKEISYRQRERGAGEWFKITRVSAKEFAIRNLGPHSLHQGVLYVGKQGYRLDGSLPPGATRRATVTEKSEAWDQQPSFSSVLSANGITLTGQLIGLRPGPQIGKEVAARTKISYMLVTTEAVK